LDWGLAFVDAPLVDSDCGAGLLQAPSTLAKKASAVIERLKNFVRDMVCA
jgi:hypothetical protein